MAKNLIKKATLISLFLHFSTSCYGITPDQAELNKVNKMLQENMEQQLKLEQESKMLQAKIEEQKRIVEAKLEQQKRILRAQKELAFHQRVYNIPTAQKHNEIDLVIQDLANRLFSSSRLKQEKIESIALTSFVNLHNFNSTSHFGRTISEAFFDELYLRGFSVSDFRGQEAISINANGEYLLTRDVKKLNKEVSSEHALVGTYTVFEKKVLINARIVEIMSGKIVASARANYAKVDCKTLNNCKKPRKIFIVSDKFNKEDIKKARKAHYMEQTRADHEQYYIKSKDYIAHTKTDNPLVNLIK